MAEVGCDFPDELVGYGLGVTYGRGHAFTEQLDHVHLDRPQDPWFSS